MRCWIASSRMLLVMTVVLLFAAAPSLAADAGFTSFIASLWPEAQKAGVSRAVFDRETRGLEPDYKLPDLLLPGRPSTGDAAAVKYPTPTTAGTTISPRTTRRMAHLSSRRPRGRVDLLR